MGRNETKKILAGGLLSLFILCCSPVEASQRMMISYTGYQFDQAADYQLFETIYLNRLNQGWTGLLGYATETHESWSNRTLAIGPIFHISPTTYITSTYQQTSYFSSSHTATHLRLDITRETATEHLGIDMKTSTYASGDKATQIAPYLRWFFNNQTSWWLKYYITLRNDDKNFSSYWTEVDYKWTPLLATKIGFTNGAYLKELGQGQLSLTDYSTFIAGIEYQLTEKFKLKYIFESRSEPDNDGLSHAIVGDCRF